MPGRGHSATWDRSGRSQGACEVAQAATSEVSVTDPTVGSTRRHFEIGEAKVVATLLAGVFEAETVEEQWDVDGIKEDMQNTFDLAVPVEDWAKEEGIGEEEVRERLVRAADEKAAKKAADFGPQIMRQIGPAQRNAAASAAVASVVAAIRGSRDMAFLLRCDLRRFRNPAELPSASVRCISRNSWRCSRCRVTPRVDRGPSVASAASPTTAS